MPEIAQPDLDILARRLRVNSIAWHMKFHKGPWETCREESCTNDHDAFRATPEAQASRAFLVAEECK